MLRYRGLLSTALLLLTAYAGRTQELFVYSEPASNMPARSTGLRLTNWMMDETEASKVNYHMIPELMWGVNKRLMIHAEGFISNRNGTLAAEGVGAYAKYRFLSHDDIYRHFRAAAFARVATNNADIHQQTIQVNGHNTGYQAGVVATQLLHKTALSVTAYYEQAFDNFGGKESKLPAGMADKAVNYILSAGRLMLPTKYKSYKQTNMNLMAELIGQSLPQAGLHSVDIAPSIQFIFMSQARLDIGYRQQLYSNMTRTAPNGLLIRVEYLLFSLGKK
ncbi:hypothetical protein GCM10023093_05400 [Nemorincola caseinilytica]|uniref:Uncharacterized protein n=1 Tax=Nemorincola caseinilytica TaxID=2054315 RepID=A0ABP8N4H9_9BACT